MDKSTILAGLLALPILVASGCREKCQSYELRYGDKCILKPDSGVFLEEDASQDESVEPVDGDENDAGGVEAVAGDDTDPGGDAAEAEAEEDAQASSDAGLNEADMDGTVPGTDTAPGTEVDTCTPASCRNGGTCPRPGAQCTCPSGFSGANCDTDACDPNPCLHGGTCRRTELGASCNCTDTGYAGTLCQTDIDECATTNLCMSPDYPCVQTLPPGYSCLGQFADWPMPDTSSGAKFAPSYDTASMAGMVVDKVTGLIWQRTVDSSWYTWSDAARHCEALALAGYDDWRLPSALELTSIAVQTTASPSIDSVAFPQTPPALFWSSSRLADPAEDRAWRVNFDGGGAQAALTSVEGRVRCVRSTPSASSAPTTRYIWDGSGLAATDTRTKLTWQRFVNEQTYTWSEAQSYCSELGTGWRLPGPKELLTLVDHSRVSPSIDLQTFPDAPAEGFWTASSYFKDSAFSLFVEFAWGEQRAAATTIKFRARCVR